VDGLKNPFGVNEEFYTFSLVILGLISETKILLAEEKSTQNSKLLKISTYHFFSKFSENILKFPKF
jgi:hypothetical protein